MIENAGTNDMASTLTLKEAHRQFRAAHRAEDEPNPSWSDTITASCGRCTWSYSESDGPDQTLSALERLRDHQATHDGPTGGTIRLRREPAP